MGISAVVLYQICLLLVALLPIQTIGAIDNLLFHSIDASRIVAKNGTLFGAVLGTFLWGVIASAVGYLFAVIYNKLERE